MLSLISKILNNPTSPHPLPPSSHTSTPSSDSTNVSLSESIHKALIGDIGGTNIRLRLIAFSKSSKIPTVIKSSENMKTNNFASFSDAIHYFLKDVSDNDWPSLAGVGMAGAVLNNENILTNAPHWPLIIGINISFLSIPSP